MRVNGAQRPVLVLTVGSVVGLAVLIGGSKLAGAQPVQTCTPKVCSVVFPIHQDGRRWVGSGNAVIFHVPVVLTSVADGRTGLMIGVHAIHLPVDQAGEAGGLSVRVQELKRTNATVIFSLTPGGHQPGTQAR
jgi:hypothetical protein